MRDKRQRKEKAARQKRRYKKLRAAIIKAYGGKCSCCGTDYWHHLAIDHVNGGGGLHRKVGMERMLKDIIKSGFSDEYQILCHNCNHAKVVLGRCTCSDE